MPWVTVTNTMTSPAMHRGKSKGERRGCGSICSRPGTVVTAAASTCVTSLGQYTKNICCSPSRCCHHTTCWASHRSAARVSQIPCAQTMLYVQHCTFVFTSRCCLTNHVALAQALQPRNVLGGPLECCCLSPRTGYYRDGFCKTDESDHGRHVICAKVWGMCRFMSRRAKGQGQRVFLAMLVTYTIGGSPPVHALVVAGGEEGAGAGSKGIFGNAGYLHHRRLVTCACLGRCRRGGRGRGRVKGYFWQCWLLTPSAARHLCTPWSQQAGRKGQGQENGFWAVSTGPTSCLWEVVWE